VSASIVASAVNLVRSDQLPSPVYHTGRAFTFVYCDTCTRGPITGSIGPNVKRFASFFRILVTFLRFKHDFFYFLNVSVAGTNVTDYVI